MNNQLVSLFSLEILITTWNRIAITDVDIKDDALENDMTLALGPEKLDAFAMLLF